MFITTICFLFLLKLRWPNKEKSSSYAIQSYPISIHTTQFPIELHTIKCSLIYSPGYDFRSEER